MNRQARIFSFAVVALAALSACSSKPAAQDAAKAEAPLHKIVGKAQVLEEAGGASDAALNLGGSSLYIWEGTHRYRLFLRTPTTLVHGNQYVVEGVHAQKVIDELGDPDQGKNGYPLQESCAKVVKMAWKNLAFDAIDVQAAVLRAKVQRYPARAVFLVTRIRPATPEDLPAAAKDKPAGTDEKKVPEISVPADKQRALLVEGSPVQPAPLWEPKGGTARCKVIINPEGKISELETGAQLCEIVQWDKFSYKPTLQGGRPVNVATEVEIRFEPRT
jgi:hypothetical protein